MLLALGVCALAQTFRGAINGSVTDPSGAVVPNARVVAENATTGIEHTTATTSNGQFAFQPANYPFVNICEHVPHYAVVFTTVHENVVGGECIMR